MFRAGIAPDKAEDADGLAPIKDDNAVWHNSRRNRLKVFMGVQYESTAASSGSQMQKRPSARAKSLLCAGNRRQKGISSSSSSNSNSKSSPHLEQGLEPSIRSFSLNWWTSPHLGQVTS